MQAPVYDLIVVGSGPAGLAAAIEASAQGLSVALIDEQSVPGGQIFRNAEQTLRDGVFGKTLSHEYHEGVKLIEDFRASSAKYYPQSTVIECEPGHACIVAGKHGVDVVNGKYTIIACGARERVVPFPGWTLSGVMSVGAAQVMYKDAQVIPSGRTVLAGSGPLIFLVADQLISLGVRISAVLVTCTVSTVLASMRHLPSDVRSLSKIAFGLAFQTRLISHRVPVVFGVKDWRALGEEGLSGVEYVKSAKSHRLDADLLLCHDGLVPSSELAIAAGCEQVWDEGIQAFRPEVDSVGRTSVPTLLIAGDCAGIAGARSAIVRGRLAAATVSRELGKLSESNHSLLVSRSKGSLRNDQKLQKFFEELFPLRSVENNTMPPDLVFCRCENVTVGEIRAALDAGCTGPNQLKTFTRCGMGPCQGRVCGNSVTRLISSYRRVNSAEVGSFRIRFPVKPVSVGDLSRTSGLAGVVELDFGGLPEARSQSR